MNDVIGQPLDRVDGYRKVTGTAKYAAEFPQKSMAYGVTVQSTISKGSIRNIETSKAESAPGVIAVITYKNALKLKQPAARQATQAGSVKMGEKELLPLQDKKIFYDGQHIAVVVAGTFEQAEAAALLIQVDYDEEKPVLDIEHGLSDADKPGNSMGRELQVIRGDPKKAFQSAEVQLQQTYSTPVYHHNPMEPHATIAEWNGDRLTVYDSTQSVLGNRNAVANALDVPPENVRLISPFVGGGFGCKGFTWGHTLLAPMVAKQVGRPVKIVLSRQQMFTCNGHRGRTIQEIGLAAGRDGKLTAIRHATTTQTSFVDEFVETCGLATRLLYASPNLEVSHQLVRVNRGTPTPTRAPGEAPGTYAVEAAMDELAYQLKLDPLQLRLINYAETDPQTGRAWSEKSLRECYQRGAQLIGWSQRNPEPGSMREGDWLVGYGVATAIYPANRVPASAKIQLYDDGHVVASSCTQDIGTGTYTIMTQIAADALKVPVERVTFELGDSQLPDGPVSGGSQTAASVGPAVHAAALTAIAKLKIMAAADTESPLSGKTESDIIADNGRLVLKSDPGKGEAYADILRRHRLTVLEVDATTNVSTRESGKKSNSQKNAKPRPGDNAASLADEGMNRDDFAFQSFGAQFAKVLVDPLLGTVRVARLVTVMDVGKVLNLKTAQNQIMGGMIFGLGMALMEESVYDPHRGRIVTRDLANYHVPVHADIPEITVEFINQADPRISPLGARGIGEIGITGSTAAIANAIFHATGKRVRDLPITPDKLIA